MRKYLEALITEKGERLDSDVLEGHFGLDYAMLIDYIEQAPQHHKVMRDTLVMIDFKNGDVFHYLKHLATGMVKTLGMDVYA